MFLRGLLFLLPLGFLETYSQLQPFLLQLKAIYQQSAAYWLHRIRAGFYWQHGGGDRCQACCLILAHVVSVAANFEGTVWVDGSMDPVALESAAVG